MADPPTGAVLTLIRIYLMIATAGAIIGVPILAFFGWYGWEWTKQDWPGNWLGWAIYAVFSAAIIIGPIIGWLLYRRGRPYWALGVSALGFLLTPLILAGIMGA